MTFSEYVTKYLGVVNPSTNLYWATADIARVSATPQPTIEEWLRYAQRISYEYAVAHKEVMPDALLIEAWNAEHPPSRTIVTPFGTYTQPLATATGRNPLDMTVRELLDAIEAMSK